MPLSISVPFDSPVHKRIIEAVRARWQMCQTKAGDRYDKWRKAEDQAMAFVKLSSIEKNREGKKEQGEPQFITLEIPYSYAQMLAAHTYDTSVFLGRNPVLQFAGRHGETADAEQAVEAIMDYQLHRGEHLVPYYLWLMDKRKYGVGVLGTYWDEEVVQVSTIVEQPRMWAGIDLGLPPKKVRQVQKINGYQGNRVFNVRPYDFIFDPRFTLGNFQKGEFSGYYCEVGWNHVKRMAEQKYWQNTENLEKTGPASWWVREKGSARLNMPNQNDVGGISYTTADSKDPTQNLTYVELCHMVIELVPKEWGIGESSYPEKWIFVIGNDRVVLEARPQGLVHDKFPFDVLENEIEAYGMFKRGMMEILQPLNDTLSWLFNTHFYNIRRVLNDQLVVDPSRVVVSDLEDPDKGRYIRLRPEAYGSPWQEAIGQLQVADVTVQHLRDAPIVMDLLQRLSGVSEGAMGLLDPGGRKTATEVRQARDSSMTRLKTEAEFSSAQGFERHAQKLLQNTQQYYNGDMWLKIAGSLMERGAKAIQVTPESILGFYDFIPVDGTMPVDRYAQAALWKELMQGMGQIPGLLMSYDLSKIFAHVAQLAGVKNVDRFRLNVTPDQQLAAQMQQGNVVPIGGGQGGSRAGSGPAPGGGPRMAGPPVVAGVGPTG